MTGETSSARLRADLDARVEALARTDAGFLAEETTLPACRDRWYGRLAVRTFEATTGESATRSDVRTAAAGVSLLRAYHERRTALVDDRDGAGEVTDHRLNRSLLVGDYLFAAAFGALESVDDPEGRCFEILVEAACSLVTGTARHGLRSDPSIADLPAYAEATAGALGAAATHVGTTLAGADPGRLAELGRYAATARRLERIREAEAETQAGDAETRAADAETRILPVDVDEAAIGDAVDRFRREAERAFWHEGRPAPLEPFLDPVVDGSGP